MNEDDAMITVTCNNVCDPLIEAKDSQFIRYPRVVMRKLRGEHGLSFHLRVGRKAIVFDTGGMLKTFLPNIKAVEPADTAIDCIVLSHGHHDHVGGLLPYLAAWDNADGNPSDIFCHPLALSARYRVRAGGMKFPLPGDEIDALRRDGKLETHAGVDPGSIERLGGRVHASREPATIMEDDVAGIRILSTGEIPRIVERTFLPDNYAILDGKELLHDTFMDDQALIIEKTGEHAILLLGCCHAGLENTIARVRKLTTLPLRAIAGGFHLSGATRETIERKIAFLERVGREIDGGPLCLRPTHCSGERFYLHLKQNASNMLDVDRLPLGTRIVP